MFVKIALWLALLACIEGHVVKLKEVPLSKEGLTLDIVVKNKGDKSVVSTMNIDIDELNKKVSMWMMEETPPTPPSLSNPSFEMGYVRSPVTGVPRIASRYIIGAGTCPIGYIKAGRFCFPSDY
ncbi:unnamed protein product [Chrysodeixis includens]|uniref:Uncharacterized protein n=1 Tax=Chrysodeixis includens TaxID=689277 RepID=A0A9P0BUB5_CHRIL|nr:unnamed protein product [Chrysodeixis includens]